MKQTSATPDPSIEIILNGDSIRFRKMYADLAPLLRSMVNKYSGSEDDARDLFQDTVLVIWQKARLPGFMLTSKFSTFFYSIAWNLWRSRCNRKMYQEVMIPEDARFIVDEGGNPQVDAEKAERQRLFDRAFDRLGADCQKLLTLFFQKTAMTDIATQMGYGSENYARRRKHECKERLVGFIQGDPAYGEFLNA